MSSSATSRTWSMGSHESCASGRVPGSPHWLHASTMARAVPAPASDAITVCDHRGQRGQRDQAGLEKHGPQGVLGWQRVERSGHQDADEPRL